MAVEGGPKHGLDLGKAVASTLLHHHRQGSNCHCVLHRTRRTSAKGPHRCQLRMRNETKQGTRTNNTQKHTRTFRHTDTQMHRHRDTHMYTQRHTQRHTHAQRQTGIRTHAHADTHRQTDIRTQTHRQTYAHTHTRTHEHTHTHTHLVQLAGASLIDTKEGLDLKGKDFCFGIQVASGRTFFLVADNAGLARKWVAAIRAAITTASGGSSNTTNRASSQRATPAASQNKLQLKQPQGPTGASGKSDFGYGASSSSSPSSSKAATSAPRASSKQKLTTAEVERKRFPRQALQDLDLNPATTSHTSMFVKLRRQRPAQLSSVDNQLERLKNRVFKLLYNDRSKCVCVWRVMCMLCVCVCLCVCTCE